MMSVSLLYIIIGMFIAVSCLVYTMLYLTKDGANALSDASDEVNKAKEITRNLKSITFGGIYGAVMSLSFEFIFSPVLFPNPSNQGGLSFLGIFMAIIATILFFGQYRALYYYGSRYKIFTLSFSDKEKYKKGRELIIKALQDKFKDRVRIDGINEGEKGNEEAAIYVDDKDRQRWIMRFTYEPTLMAISVRIDLEHKFAQQLVRLLKTTLIGDDSANKRMIF
ncbi:MAG TPA: hypothetical protein VL944_02165 [Candidatus Acidoferrum sp.]|nr:hypothetical protein [Candidatus Acidoferrum sp.]